MLIKFLVMRDNYGPSRAGKIPFLCLWKQREPLAGSVFWDQSGQDWVRVLFFPENAPLWRPLQGALFPQGCQAPPALGTTISSYLVFHPFLDSPTSLLKEQI